MIERSAKQPRRFRIRFSTLGKVCHEVSYRVHCHRCCAGEFLSGETESGDMEDLSTMPQDYYPAVFVLTSYSPSPN